MELSSVFWVPFVTGNAKQAFGYQIAVAVLAMAIMTLLVGFLSSVLLLGDFMGGHPMHHFPLFGVFGLPFFAAFNIAVKGCAIYAAVKAVMGEEFKYIFIGDFIARL